MKEMNKFGIIKSKVLQKITDAYINGKKDEVKNTLKLIKESKEFLNLYLFYEEVENKNIEDNKHAELFVEEIVPMLKKQMSKVLPFSKSLDKKLGDVTVTENELYSNLDILAEDDTLKNVDRKIRAKKKLVEHLLTKKEISEPTSTTIIENTTLLNTILASNFNILYSNTLTEDEKKELSTLLSIPEAELNANFSKLQEEVTEKMNKMITEEKKDDLKSKLINAVSEAGSMKPSKFNYYKLQQLKKGL
jgi:hypothetical protein